MNFEWNYSDENMDWLELSNLYQIAPLGYKEPADLKVSFNNSMFKCFVYHSGRLVAVGRALADGKDCSYICDVAVHPDFQGQGLGKEVVSKLLELSKNHVKIILYTSPGNEPFYQKLGFKRMRTALAIFKDQDHALGVGLIEES